MCIFCKIAAGEIPSTIVYQDDDVLAFRDINPQAPTHIVVIPKAHVLEGVKDVTEDNADLVAKCFIAIAKIAKEQGLDNGYRVITNCGADACQSVQHLHFHLLGGKQLSEKMD